MTHDRSSTKKLWKNEYEFEVDKDLLVDEKNIVYLVLGPPAFISNIVEDVYTKFGGSSSGEYSCIDVSHSFDTSISLQMKALARKRTLPKSVVAISGFDRAKVFDEAAITNIDVMVVGDDLNGSEGIDKRGLFDYIYQLTDSSSEISGFVVLLLFEDEHGSSFPSLRNYSSGELDEAEPLDWKAWFASISESDSLNINGAALAGRISRAAVYYPPSLSSPYTTTSTTSTTTTYLSSKSFCERFQPNQRNSSIYGAPSTAALVSLVVVLVLTVVISYKWLFKVRTDNVTDSSSSLVSSLSSSDSDSATSSSTKDAPSTASSSSHSTNGSNSSGSNSTTTTTTTTIFNDGSSNNSSTGSSELSSAIHTTSSITSSDNLTTESNRTTATTTTIKKQPSKGRNSKKLQSKEGVVGSPPPSPSGGSTTSNTTPDKGNPPSHDHYLRSLQKRKPLPK